MALRQGSGNNDNASAIIIPPRQPVIWLMGAAADWMKLIGMLARRRRRNLGLQQANLDSDSNEAGRDSSLSDLCRFFSK